MASVTSLDKDMRMLRMDKYTPQAANEARDWIEGILGEKLAEGDLLDALKDGVALCKLANLALPPPGLRFKASSMPFVQMENISLFLQACQSPLLGLQPHDVFLTVDLYEQKDPAQVLQCLCAFSRVANQVQPSRFPIVIGPKSRGGASSPQRLGTPTVGGGSYGNRRRGESSASNNSAYHPVSRVGTVTPTRTGDSNGGTWNPTKDASGRFSPSPAVSSWSKKDDEGATSPAWNIAQYGYMGGASQGNMGVSFGGRRQITSAGPNVPNMAEKERRRKEADADAERQRVQMEEAEHKRRTEREAEEEIARIAEEEEWAEKTMRLREEERLKAEEEKRKWDEEEVRWKVEEERRHKEETEALEKLEQERRREKGRSDALLRGQFLSQYQAEQLKAPRQPNERSENSRILELERELEQARERERQYELERQQRAKAREHQVTENHDMISRLSEESAQETRPGSASRLRLDGQEGSQDSWQADEREYLRREAAKHADIDVPSKHTWQESEREFLRHEHARHNLSEAPAEPPRPLPEPNVPVRVKTNNTGPSSRPLPDPAKYASPPTANAKAFPPHAQNRTDRFLSSNPAPQQPRANTTYSNELGAFDSTAERDSEDQRRVASQAKTKAGGWASKSLLEREMELERQRQQEWEEAQKSTAQAAKMGPQKDGVDGIGGGIGGKWDVNQWTGYTGGDGQNRGSQGIGASRRQIAGPRPPPGR
ncbi:MAG: hypothetical protein M1818_006315 [Claussenomyces sp. TS43310]|nr:MAG: hypothetical protein M1818_006315 [Claussenomyces sp. TS43310]